MTALPNPWLSNFASAEGAPAAASIAPTPMQQPEAPIIESPMTMEDIREAPVAVEPAAAGATDDIHEIFYHARLLAAEDNAVHRRFVLDQRAFEEALEEPPTFLQAMSA